jgi:hypothetical protein
MLVTERRYTALSGGPSMRPSLILTCAAVAAAFALPARAGTLQEVTTHGMVVTIADMDIDVAFTPDGKFTALNGAIAGTWRIDGDKLCTTTPEQGENCTAYPADKKSGDTFEVSNDQGSAKVHIK